MKGRHCLWLCRWITLQLSQVSGVVDLTEIQLDRLKTKQKQKNQSKSKQLRWVSYVCGNSRTEPWKLENNLQIIATTRPFIDQYDYKEISPQEKKTGKSLKRKIAFTVFSTKQYDQLEKIRQAYISKHIQEREHQAILVMMTDGEKRHYLTVISLFTLLKRWLLLYELSPFIQNKKQIWITWDVPES